MKRMLEFLGGMILVLMIVVFLFELFVLDVVCGVGIFKKMILLERSFWLCFVDCWLFWCLIFNEVNFLCLCWFVMECVWLDLEVVEFVRLLLIICWVVLLMEGGLVFDVDVEFVVWFCNCCLLIGKVIGWVFV